MSHVSAGSTKSHAASEICRHEEKFSVWAREVPAVYKPRVWGRIPSGVIADMVKESQCLPEWLFKKDSLDYKLFEKLYPREVNDLMVPSPGPENTTSDPSVSTDLAHAMPHIIHVVRRHTALLQDNELAFNEADLRQPLDRLACHVWESASEKMFRFRSECLLKLPQTSTYPIPKAIVDSVSFFTDSDPQYTLLKTNSITAEGVRCSVNSTYRLVLVHWVTEYEGDTLRLQEVERRVYYGIVSGLWQRRILGRMDDYVFGTAHAGSDLTVYAARWEKRSTGSSNKSDLNLKPKSPAPVATRSEASDKSLKLHKAGEVTGKAQPGSELTPTLTKDDHASDKASVKPMGGENDDYEIVVYQLEQYSTGTLMDMIQFYLLMRASRQLAGTYRAQIFVDKWPIFLAEIRARPQFKWSPLPPPHAGRSNSEDIPEDSNTGENLAEALAVGYNGGADTRSEFEAACPEQVAEWKEEWGRQRQSAVRRCGPGSLVGFKPTKADTEGLDLSDRVSTYLGSLY